MARKRKQNLPLDPVEAVVEDLSHDGRGVAHVEGKTVFIQGALAGERVLFTYRRRRGRFDEGVVHTIIEAAAERVEPGCPHFGSCGGCSLQHLAPEAQRARKEQTLLSNLRHFGNVAPETVLPPLTGPLWGYRRKARLGVRHVAKKGGVLVGFREKGSSFITEIGACPVLVPQVGERIGELRALIGSLDARDAIPQIEMAAGDEHTVLVFRNMVPLGEADRARLAGFGAATGLRIHLQPAGPESVHPLGPGDAVALTYRLPAYDVEVLFQPTDFAQVNAEINLAMVDHALTLLEPSAEDRILDLFCGLGNFTLPLARRCGAVVGVEGDAGMVARAGGNALRNGITNAEFHAADLAGDFSAEPWARAGFHKVLLDPPRTGALEMVRHLPAFGAGRVVYVSCNPATLARDAGVLVREGGYRLVSAGIMDMFPHTTHVESIALFEKPW